MDVGTIRTPFLAGRIRIVASVARRSSCYGRCWPTATRLSVVFAVLTAVALIVGLIPTPGYEGWAFGFFREGIGGRRGDPVHRTRPSCLAGTQPRVQPHHRQRRLQPPPAVIRLVALGTLRSCSPAELGQWVSATRRAPQHPSAPQHGAAAADTVTKAGRPAARHARSILGCCATAGQAEVPAGHVVIGLASAAAVLGQAIVLASAITSVMGAPISPAIGPDLPCSPGSSGLRAIARHAQGTAAARRPPRSVPATRRCCGGSSRSGRRSSRAGAAASLPSSPPAAWTASIPTSPATCPSWCSPAWCRRCSWWSSGSPTGCRG